MAKKDIIDRLSKADEGTRRRTTDATATRSRGDTVVTQVKKGVVRRRARRRRGGESAEGEETTKDVVVRRRAAPATEDSEPAQAEAAPEQPAEAAPEQPAAEEPKEAAAPEVVPTVEEALEAASEEVAPVEEPAVEAKAEEPAAEAKAEEPAAEAKAEEPAAEEKPAAKGDSGRKFQGLGSAVVVPPPGYDPSNPEAYREQQKREQVKQAASRPSSDSGERWRSRRRVAAGGGGAGGGRSGRRARMVADRLGGVGMRGRRRKKRRGSSGPSAPSPQPKAQKRKIRVEGTISVGQLAHELSVKAPMVIKKLMELGSLHTVNDMLDIDTATLVAAEFEYEVENVAFDESEFLQEVAVDEEVEENLEPRPPVVTIMGHVDHGKTTLLDAIREARVAAGEAGGITQHIGAYQVDWKGSPITFLDTPGHAAFSAMRARGASVTDIVVLVVAADDGVQPQTVEAINHAKAADVPIVVAVNKMDKPGVNPETVMTRLGEHELVPEEWGGETQFVKVSALKKEGLDDLLEALSLQAEILELEANPERPAEGVVIEAKMERGRGPVATVLVQTGTLKAGEHVVIGATYGKVRAMMDHRGKKLKKAGPSTPVEIFGLQDLPTTGDSLNVVKSEKDARTLAEHRAQQARDAEMAKNRRRTIEDLKRLAGEEERKVLLVLLKADVSGSLEALKQAVQNIDVDGCEVRILHEGVGNISESDVNLAAASDAMVVGFNVRPDARARSRADEAGIDFELHTVIYSVLDRIEAELKGLREPEYEEQSRGSAEVRATFSISKIGTIAGCFVLDGTIGRNHGARVFRDNEEIWKGDIKQLKRFKDDVKEVSSGYECGILLDGFNDIQEGDVIQSFEMVEIEIT